MAKKFSKIDLSEKDVFQDIRESAASAETKISLLKTALAAILEAQKQIKVEASTSKKNLFGLDPSNVKIQKELNVEITRSNDLVQKNTTYTNARKQATQALTIEEAKLKEQTRKANLESRQVAKLKLAEKGSVDALRARLAILNREWDKLSNTEREYTKRGARLKQSIDQTTASVTKLEQSTNRHQRNVGNYSSALDGLKGKFSSLASVAGQFGFALGGVAIVRGSINTIKEFETQVADLSAVTGQTGKDLDFLKNKAIDFSKKYGESAASIAEAFKLAGSARPELLKNGDALAKLTEQAILLSKASGDDVPTSIANLTGTLNAFNLPASESQKVMDTLANAAQLGAQEIPYLTEAFTKFGGVAANANIGVAESAAAVELLGKKIPEASIAGNNLKNIMIILQTEASKQGREFLGLTAELERMKPKLKDVAALEKIFGKENILAAQTLIGQTDELKKFTGALDKNGTTQEQAAIKSKTLAEAGKRLSATWDAFVLNATNGVGASEGLTNALDFLADNFDTILTVVGKLIKVFLVYKGVMTAIKIKDKATEFMAFSKAAKESGQNLSGASEGAKGFGQALKGIGLSVAITLAIELATALYDVASGAAAAREQQMLLEKYNADAQKRAGERVSKRQSDLNKEIAALQRLRNENKLTEEQFIKQKQAAIDQTKNSIEQDIKAVRSRKNMYLQFREEMERTLAAQKNGEVGNLENARRIAELLKIQGDSSWVTALTGENDAATVEEILRSLNAKIQGAGEKIKIYKQELDGVGESLKDVTSELEVNTVAHEDNTSKINAKIPKIQEQTKAMKSANDEIERMNNLMRETQELDDEIGLSEAELNLQYSIKQQLDNINESGQYSIDLIKQRIDEENALRKAIIERVYLEQLDAATNEQEVINARKKRDFELGKLEEETSQKTIGILTDLEDAQESYAEKTIETSEIAKKSFEDERKWIEFTEKLFTSNIDKKIAAIDKEIEAHKKRADELRELANQGNIEAKDSIAEQERLEAEALAKKERLEKRKQRLQTVAAFLTSYTNALESGKSGFEALATASTDKALLESIIEAMPVFLEGAEDTGKGGDLDDDGGFAAILHPHERVLTKEQNQAIGTMSNADLVNTIQMAKISGLSGNIAPSGWENAAIIAELSGLKDEIKDVKKAIEDKPVPNLEVGEVYQHAFKIISSMKSGNKTESKIFRVS